MIPMFAQEAHEEFRQEFGRPHGRNSRVGPALLHRVVGERALHAGIGAEKKSKV